MLDELSKQKTLKVAKQINNDFNNIIIKAIGNTLTQNALYDEPMDNRINFYEDNHGFCSKAIKQHI